MADSIIVALVDTGFDAIRVLAGSLSDDNHKARILEAINASE